MALFNLLNVNKPAGVTSRQVVNRVALIVHPAKAGHAGTLDPLATGVLVICVGQATRLIRFVQRMRKQYRAAFLLGHSSETHDIEREVIAIPDAIVPTRATIESMLPQFIGDIRQRPPIHSAIKIEGRRAYKLARKGANFELAERTVTIHRIDLLRYEYPELDLDIECGSGTYIRSLARDLGAALGTAAVMSALERTAIGSFHIERSIAFDRLSTESLRQNLQPAVSAISDLPQVELSDAQIVEIRHGRPIPMPAVGAAQNAPANITEWAAVNSRGELVSLLTEKRPDELWPQHNFHDTPSTKTAAGTA